MTQDPRQLDPDRLAREARSLRALARAAARGEADADDLAQEAWVTALQRPPESGFSLRSWLRGIVRNHARDAARSGQRRAAHEELAARPEATDLEDTVERLDLLRHLLAQARRLEEPFRTTVLLRYVDGLSTPEIAERLGVPVGTVRGRLHRGLQRLRERMDDTVPGGGGRAAWWGPLAFYLPSPAGAVAALSLPPAAVGSTVFPAATGLILSMTIKQTLLVLTSVVAVGLGTLALWPEPAAGPSNPGSGPAAGAARSASSAVAGETRAASSGAASGDRPTQERTAVELAAGPAGPDPTGPGLTVRGVVRSTVGEPIAAAEVLVGVQDKQDKATFDALFSSKISYSKRPVPSLNQVRISTDDAGRFVALLPVETLERAWSVYARVKAHGFASRRVESVTVPGAPEAVFEIVMTAGLRIAGRVVDGQDGRPLQGAQVTTGRMTMFAVETGREGRFLFDDVEPKPGPLRILAVVDGYLDAYAEVAVDPQTRSDEVLIELERGTALSGRVLAAGAPVEGAELRILRPGKQGKGSGFLDKRARSGADGSYRFPALPGGSLALTVRHPDFPPLEEIVEVPLPSGPAAEVRHEVHLEAGRSVRGVVRDDAGRPVSGAEVVAVRNSRQLRGVESDAEGAFELQGLPFESLQVHANATGYVKAEGQEVAPTVSVVEVVLRAGASFAGTVIDATSGRPVESFLVRVWNKPVEEGGKGADKRYPLGGWQKFRSATGAFVTTDVVWPEGFVADLEVRSDRHATGRVAGAVAAREPDPAALRIELVTGATLRGKIRDADGLPLSDAQVELLLAEALPDAKSVAGGSAKIRSGADGGFEIANVPAGAAHRLRVTHPAHGQTVASFSVPEGVVEWEVDVDMEAGVSLTGTVRKPTGGLVAEAPVTLTRLDAPAGARRSWRTRSDAEGRYRFGPLTPGSYELQRIERADEAVSGKPMPLFSLPVQIEGAGALEVELAPRGAGEIRGQLSSSVALPETVYLRLEPLEEDAGEAEPAMRRFPRWARSEGASFRIPYLLAGRYRISAWPGTAGGLEGDVEVEVRDGVETRATLELRTPR